MSVSLKALLVAGCFTLSMHTSGLAQDVLVPIEQFRQQSSQQDTESVSTATKKAIPVPELLTVDPRKVTSEAIQSGEGTSVPPSLKSPSSTNAESVSKIGVSESDSPQGAQTVAAWQEVTLSSDYEAEIQPIPVTAQEPSVLSRAQNIARTAPAISTEIVAPEFINLNQPATMRINIRNTGSTEIQNVRLVTTLPPHAKFQSADPQPEKIEGQTYEFLMSSIGANQVRQISLDMVPTEKMPLDIATRIVVENQQRIEVSVRQPRLNLQMSGPDQVTIGDVVEHTVTIENIGDGVAESVKLEATLPNELEFSEQTGMEIAKNLEPGDSRQVVVRTIARQPGVVDLTFLATAVGTDSEKTQDLLKIVQPELEVSVSGPKMNFVNRDGIYSIRLDNKGEVDVANVEVSLHIPVGMKVTTINRPAKTDERTRTLVWTFDQIAMESSETIQLKATAKQAGEQLCLVDISSDKTEPKQFSMATQVAARAEMSVHVRNQTGPVQMGEQADFTVAVENTGSSKAEAVSVRVELPESLMPVKQDGVSVDQYNRSFVFNQPALEPGEKHDFNFSVVGVVGGEFVVRGVLESNGSGRQMIAEDSVFVYEVDEFRVSESLTPSFNR